MDKSKVKVNKELFKCLKFVEKKHGKNSLKMVLKEKTRGHIYRKKEYVSLNEIELEEMSKICFNGYELDQKEMNNPILENVHQLLSNQTAKGLAKYGKTVDVNDYTTEQWIDHVSEEIIDTLVYLQCIKESMKNERRDNS